MVMTSPDVIVLSAAQRQGLARIVRAGKSAQRLALRARIVLAAAAGCGNAAIGVRLGVCVDTVRKWRHRWAVSPGVASLTDAKRCGRPAGFTPVQVAHVKALACQPPPGRRGPVAVELPRAGAPGDDQRRVRQPVAVHGAPLARAGRAQAVAVPVLDLDP